jgi:hypothetical protein
MPPLEEEAKMSIFIHQVDSQKKPAKLFDEVGAKVKSLDC